MNTTFTTAGRTTFRTLGLAALAAPIAAALTVGAATAAHAEDELVLGTVVAFDGTPNPDIPEGPGDLTTEEDCQQTDTCGGGGEEDPDGTPNPDIPEGPGDLVAEQPCQQTNTCDGGGGGGGGEGEGTNPENGEPGDGDDYAKPTRIDAGTAGTEARTAGTEAGLDLAWALPGGLLVSAAGLAFATRRTRTGERA